MIASRMDSSRILIGVLALGSMGVAMAFDFLTHPPARWISVDGLMQSLVVATLVGLACWVILRSLLRNIVLEGNRLLVRTMFRTHRLEAHKVSAIECGRKVMLRAPEVRVLTTSGRTVRTYAYGEWETDPERLVEELRSGLASREMRP